MKLEVQVQCRVGLAEFAPPMRVIVNGEALPCLLNDGHSAEKNRLTTWCNVPVRLKGPDAIVISLEPVGSAARLFHPSESKKQRYQAAYTRNAIELHGGTFVVPPKTDDYPSHKVEIVVEARGRGPFGMLGPGEAIDQWRIEAGDTTAPSLTRW